MDCIHYLDELCKGAAVSGYEETFARKISAIFSKYCDDVETDTMFNVIGKKGAELQDEGTLKQNEGTLKKEEALGIKPFNTKPLNIMVLSHYDEIGLVIKSIDDKGFLKFACIGGIDRKILPAAEVVIHGTKDMPKDIPGVIGAKPPHLLQSDESRKVPVIDDMSIDTGLDVNTVKKYISIGDIATFKCTPFVLNNKRYSSKSLDNRCGVAAQILIMKELYNIRHRNNIYFIATVQEEVDSLAGARAAAYKLKPDIAVVIDACHGDMPEAPKDECFSIGKGPAIAIGPNIKKKYAQLLINIARNENIPFQIDVEPGDTGTEAWATQVSRAGIPTVLVSVPVRYMHTPVETADIKDIENTAKLIAKFIISAGKTEV